ncbi:MAG TPA: RDD family protein [Lysobacter sp.]|nr:RDD family protein [Lysobacter sp.]
MTQEKLDTFREVVTPEGVALRLPAAGPVPRALAWTIDFLLRGALLFALGMVLGLLGRAGSGPYLVALFTLVWLYPVVFEALGGRTPGKRALGLRVLAANGAPVGWRAALVRNLLRVVDMLPFGYAAGLVSTLADPHARRLGDLVAGTVVVHDVQARPAPPGADVAPVPPPVALLPHEQAALIAFAERAPLLTPARQVELAELAAPLAQAHGPAAVARLLAFAHWLLGRR